MKTEEFDLLIKRLQDLNIHQKYDSWDENIPDDVWDEYFHRNHEELEDNIDVKIHRHYEISIIAIKIFGRVLGIKHVSKLYSESSSVEDCFHTLEFFEMEETTKITYKKLIT